MSQIYRCNECGETTIKKNEYQCPYCKTTDALYPVREMIFDEEEQIFDIFGENSLHIINDLDE